MAGIEPRTILLWGKQQGFMCCGIRHIFAIFAGESYMTAFTPTHGTLTKLKTKLTDMTPTLISAEENLFLTR